MKKFYAVIGNPPYQEDTESDSTRLPPIYNRFMDGAYEIGEKVELITPARFLFNAGYTPKDWNRKMLDDPHLKVLKYISDSSIVFPDNDIKGGVAVTYRDSNSAFGPINVFTKYAELNTILSKVLKGTSHFLDEVISSPLSYKLSDLMRTEHPDLSDRLRSSAFSTLAPIFFDKKPDDSQVYIKMVGLDNGKRAIKYVRRDYIKDSGGTLDSYSLLMAKAIGSGVFGESLSKGYIADPGTGYLQTFIGIGQFGTRAEAENAEIYTRTKFARALLGVLKITQDCPGPKWHYVPLQDFTSASDIDWDKSVSDIDKQLYAKYGLDDKEITFIESHVKEMN